MCLAVPGKIISIKGNEAIVDYELEQRKGMILDPESNEFSVGDYAIIQGGFLVQKIEEKEAQQALQLYKESFN